MSMFSNLRKKIQSSDGNISILPTLSERDSGELALGKTPSIESLESGGGGLSETRSRRKDELVKRMETKLLDMANMLREKNEHIDELTRRQQQERDEKEKIINMIFQCGVTEPMFIMEEIRQDLQRRMKDTQASIPEREWLLERITAMDERFSKFRCKQQLSVSEEMPDLHSSGQNSQTGAAMSQIYSLLCNGEAQLQQCQRNLFSSQNELDSTKQQLEQIKREKDVQEKWCASVQVERDHLEADNQRWQSAVRDLQLVREDLRKQIEDLTEVKEEKEAELRAAECLSSQTQDHLEMLQHDYDILKHKFAHHQETSSAREVELQHKINVLQSQLSHWEKNVHMGDELNLDDGDTLDDLTPTDYITTDQMHDNQLQKKQMQTKILLLTRERDQLEETVNSVRNQFHDNKMSSMDRMNTLECQIAKLNTKLASDSQEFQQEKQSMRQTSMRLEKQAQEAKLRCREMEERVNQLEQQNAELQRQCRRWQNQYKKCETESQSHVDSLRDQLEHLNAERIVDKKTQDELQLTLNAHNSRVQELTQKVSALNRELILAKDELSERTNRVNQLEKERFELNLRFSELKSQVSSSNEECGKLRSISSAMQEELVSAKADLRIAEESCRSMDTQIKTFEKQKEECERECNERVRRLQEEVDGKISEISHLRCELSELKTKIADLQEEKETVLVNFESTELIQVKKELAELQSQMNDKNKTIKIQKQRLQELKKTLEKELRVQNFTPAACGISFPPALADAPRAGVLVKEASCKNGTNSHECLAKSSLHEERSPNLVNSMNENASGDSESLSSTAMNSFSTGQVSSNSGSSSTETVNTVNYRYLRHVVIKFLICKESEAVHLIRALSTLLKLSEEEEELLRQTLEYRRSWFVSRPTLSGGTLSSQSFQHSMSSTSSHASSSPSFFSQNQ